MLSSIIIRGFIQKIRSVGRVLFQSNSHETKSIFRVTVSAEPSLVPQRVNRSLRNDYKKHNQHQPTAAFSDCKLFHQLFGLVLTIHKSLVYAVERYCPLDGSNFERKFKYQARCVSTLVTAIQGYALMEYTTSGKYK